MASPNFKLVNLLHSGLAS